MSFDSSDFASAAVSALLGYFMAAIKQTDRLLLLHTPLGSDVLLPESFKGIEAISGQSDGVTGFQFQLDALSLNPDLELKALIGQPVLLELQTDQSRLQLRPFHGHITRFECLGVTQQGGGGLARYRLTIEPWLRFLGHGRDSAVFQDMNVLAIVDSILGDYQSSLKGAGQLVPQWRLDIADPAVYPKRSLTTQYQESDLAFIERLLLEEGLFYWFEHSGDASSASLGAHTLVIADHNGAFKPNVRSQVRFSQSQSTIADDTLDRFAPQAQWHTHGIELASWDYRTLSARPVAEHAPAGEGSGVPAATPALLRQDTPGAYAYESAAQGQRLALNQLQAVSANGQTIAAAGSVRAFAPGSTVRVTGHVTGHVSRQAAHQGELVLVQVRHQGRNNLGAQLGGLAQTPIKSAKSATSAINTGASSYRFNSGLEEDGNLLGFADAASHTPAIFYRNACQLLPLTVPYRACTVDGHGQLIAPKPTAPGSQTALVIGAPGEHLTTDRDGRVKVQFAWQRGPASHSRLSHPAPDGHSGALAEDGTSATTGTWVRVASTLGAIAGANWGSVALPRIGQEVLITFLNGDIDRPVITGAVYNGRGQANAQGNDVAQGAANATGNAPMWFAGEGQGESNDQSNGQGHAHGAVLSGLKSQALSASQSGQGGYSQLVFDDSPGHSRLGLQVHSTGQAGGSAGAGGTHSGTAELNLGHLRHQADNQRLSPTGFGLELKTPHSGAVRAASGLLISADKKAGNECGASSHQMASEEAQAQLQSGRELMTSLAKTAQQHKAMLPVLKTSEVKPYKLPVALSFVELGKSLNAVDVKGTGRYAQAAPSQVQGIVTAALMPGPCDWLNPGKFHPTPPPQAMKKLERPWAIYDPVFADNVDEFVRKLGVQKDVAENLEHVARLNRRPWRETILGVNVKYLRLTVFIKSPQSKGVIPVFIDVPDGDDWPLGCTWPDHRKSPEFGLANYFYIAAGLAKLTDQQLVHIKRVVISPVSSLPKPGPSAYVTSNEIKIFLQKGIYIDSPDWHDELVLHEAAHITDDVFNVTYDSYPDQATYQIMDAMKVWVAKEKATSARFAAELKLITDQENTILVKRRTSKLTTIEADRLLDKLTEKKYNNSLLEKQIRDKNLTEYMAIYKAANDSTARSAERNRKWKLAMRLDNQSISTYAKTNETEDFAEHYVAYRCAKGTPCEMRFRELYAHRYAYFKALEAGQQLPST